MKSFTMEFAPLEAGGEPVGRIGVIPWDTEIFERGVAALEVDDDAGDRVEAAAFASAIGAWMRERGVSTVTASVRGDSPANAFVQRAGFDFVELSLETYLAGAATATSARRTGALRQASEEDWPRLEAIAAVAFRHGRYHADPAFPRELADRRYVVWMRNARAATSHGATRGDIVYVLGEPGDPRAFFHVVLRDDDVVDMRLAAVDPAASNGMLGVVLYRAVVDALRELGARSFFTRVAASNTPVLNLFASMGFLFRDPKNIYNFHAEKTT